MHVKNALTGGRDVAAMEAAKGMFVMRTGHGALTAPAVGLLKIVLSEWSSGKFVFDIGHSEITPFTVVSSQAASSSPRVRRRRE